MAMTYPCFVDDLNNFANVDDGCVMMAVRVVRLGYPPLSVKLRPPSTANTCPVM